MMTKQPFERVVREHGGTVLRVCRAVLGPVDADDAWSETFLAALRAWAELPPDANVQAWLVTIAHRKAIDITRARQRHAVPVAELPGAISDAAAADHDLTRAVADLPEKQRQVVAYHYLADLPYAEVALIVGGTPAAARRAAADGIKNLRGRLAVTEGALP
jgi:RNA polymerase sigma factor (sigma-70 family)